MASEKLQVARAIDVNPADGVKVPNPAKRISSGQTTNGAADKLIDSNANFTNGTYTQGDIIYNTTDGTAAEIVAIDSATQLSISDNIFSVSPKNYVIYEGDYEGGCVLYVGVGGNVRVVTVGGDDVTFQNLNNGQFVPVHIREVYDTGTTSLGLIAMW